MARVLSTVVVLALLAATAVAFAITEGAKLDKSPIAATRVDPLFSPEGTDKRVAHIRFRLRTRERISVWIRDSDGDNVRTLLTNRSAPRGARFNLVWDGFSPSGIVQPDGTYEPVVKLGRSHRTIVLPSPIVLDTKPPTVTVKHPQYPLLSPDGDGRRDSFRVAVQAERAGARDPRGARPPGALHARARRRRASSSGTAGSRTRRVSSSRRSRAATC